MKRCGIHEKMFIDDIIYVRCDVFAFRTCTEYVPPRSSYEYNSHFAKAHTHSRQFGNDNNTIFYTYSTHKHPTDSAIMTTMTFRRRVALGPRRRQYARRCQRRRRRRCTRASIKRITRGAGYIIIIIKIDQRTERRAISGTEEIRSM